MSTFISVEVSDKAVRTALDAAAQALADPRELLDTIGATLMTNIELRFDTKQDPNGTPWAPWAASTQAAYNRADRVAGKDGPEVRPQGSLLERTGQMRASLSRHVSGTSVEVGMSRAAPGGKWSLPWLHEAGTKHMPRRGMLFADPEEGTLGAGDVADVLADIEAFLDGVFD